jgi:hypothetical protein
MRAGDDVREHDDGRPTVGRQQEPRGFKRVVRRYRTYLRLLVASLVVGLAVGVGSWWYFKPHEIPTTCYEWNQSAQPFKPLPLNPQTDCVLGRGSLAELGASPLTSRQQVIRVWPSTLTVPFDSTVAVPPDWTSRRSLQTTGGLWPRALTASVTPDRWLLPAVRNGLIAAGVAYLLLILIVVPARMLKRPD